MPLSTTRCVIYQCYKGAQIQVHPSEPSPLGISPCSQIPSQNCLPTTHQSQTLNEYINEHPNIKKKNKMAEGLHGNHVKTLQSTML